MSTVYYLVRPELKELEGRLRAAADRLIEQMSTELASYKTSSEPIPSLVEDYQDEVVRKIRNAIHYVDFGEIDFCSHNSDGFHFRRFDNLRGLTQWLESEAAEGRTYTIKDEYDDEYTLAEFEQMVLANTT